VPSPCPKRLSPAPQRQRAQHACARAPEPRLGRRERRALVGDGGGDGGRDGDGGGDGGDGDGYGGGGEGGESAEVGWRSARARAETARVLCSLVRALRLRAGAGEGSDAGADAAERARQLAAAAAAVEALLGADVGDGLCLFELYASSEHHARVAAWGYRGMMPELVGPQGSAEAAKTYRRPQDWTSSAVPGEALQRATFTAVRLWPPEGTPEVHLAAVGVAPPPRLHPLRTRA